MITKILDLGLCDMNDYQKKLLEGLERFSSAIDEMTEEQLDTRISNSKVKDKFQHYETFEKLLLTTPYSVNSWSGDQKPLIIEAEDNKQALAA